MAKTDHDEDAGELTEIRRYVGFDGQGLEVDDTQQKLAVKDAEVQWQALGPFVEPPPDQLTHE
jgi:hypothetical protein